MDSTQRTLCLIKPDAHRFFTEILSDLSEHFQIVGLRMFLWSKEEAGIFYLEHKGKEFYEGLLEHMTSGPIIAVVLEGQDAVMSYRRLLGATDPRKANLGTFRQKYGRGIPNNAMHGSDSEGSAEREISFLFRDEELI